MRQLAGSHVPHFYLAAVGNRKQVAVIIESQTGHGGQRSMVTVKLNAKRSPVPVRCAYYRDRIMRIVMDLVGEPGIVGAKSEFESRSGAEDFMPRWNLEDAQLISGMIVHSHNGK